MLKIVTGYTVRYCVPAVMHDVSPSPRVLPFFCDLAGRRGFCNLRRNVPALHGGDGPGVRSSQRLSSKPRRRYLCGVTGMKSDVTAMRYTSKYVYCRLPLTVELGPCPCLTFNTNGEAPHSLLLGYYACQEAKSTQPYIHVGGNISICCEV